MVLLNLYSVAHLAIWFFVGRFTRIGWVVFVVLSLGWEVLELVLPFQFAEEWIGNKLTDVLVNVLGFFVGKYLKERVKNTSGL